MAANLEFPCGEAKDLQRGIRGTVWRISLVSRKEISLDIMSRVPMTRQILLESWCKLGGVSTKRIQRMKWERWTLFFGNVGIKILSKFPGMDGLAPRLGEYITLTWTWSRLILPWKTTSITSSGEKLFPRKSMSPSYLILSSLREIVHTWSACILHELLVIILQTVSILFIATTIYTEI